jgi:hypothetical protein
MKTKQLLFSGIFLAAFCFNANAQATQATNAISSTSYLGTSNNFDVTFKRQAVTAGLLSTNKTSFGLNSLAMPNSVSFGVGAGKFSSGTGFNTYIGQNAGMGSSLSTLNTGTYNTFIGNGSGEFNTTGSGNVFIGAQSGPSNSAGMGNTFVGTNSGEQNQGSANVYVGKSAGQEGSGSNNTYIGSEAGFDASGSNNVLIGKNAGYAHGGNDNLIIDNTGTAIPLIWGNFALDQLKFNGKVGIGYDFGNYPTAAGSVDVSGYNLFVKGGILTEEVRVSLQSTWADYVFSKDYKLPSLFELEDFIETNGHLPNVPSAQTVKEDGIELGEMAKIQQEKIEELTLYIIQLNKEIENLKTTVQVLMEKK